MALAIECVVFCAPRRLRAGKQLPAAAPPPLPEGPKDPPQLVEAIMKLFDRWARLLEESPQEKVHAPFVQELQQAGFLKVRRRVLIG